MPRIVSRVSHTKASDFVTRLENAGATAELFQLVNDSRGNWLAQVIVAFLQAYERYIVRGLGEFTGLFMKFQCFHYQIGCRSAGEGSERTEKVF